MNIQQSRLWQNPSISLEQSGFGSGQEQEFNVGVSQPLDLFGQRKLNRVIANTSNQQINCQQSIYGSTVNQLIVKFAWSQFALAEVEQSAYSVQLKTSKANPEQCSETLSGDVLPWLILSVPKLKR